MHMYIWRERERERERETARPSCDPHHYDVCVRCMILKLYHEYGTAILKVAEAPTAPRLVDLFEKYSVSFN